MEPSGLKAPTFAEFDSDLATAMERIQSARRRGDCRGPGRWILNQTPEGKINAAQTEFEPARIRVRQSD
jgi:hypothetical protein